MTLRRNITNFTSENRVAEQQCPQASLGIYLVARCRTVRVNGLGLVRAHKFDCRRPLAGVPESSGLVL